jgi:hypothetical protein
MLKILQKKISPESQFIRMANGSSEPAAAPRTVKARVNRLLKQRRRLEDAIPETQAILVPYLEKVLGRLKRSPTKYQASFAANASNCIDIWLACELTDDDKDRIARIHRIGRYRIDSPIKATC